MLDLHLLCACWCVHVCKEKPEKIAKRAKREATPLDVKIARNGNLLVKYYSMLNYLPTQALPSSPPVGQHQYTVSLSKDVSVAINLTGTMRVKHMPTGRTRQFTFHGSHQIGMIWWEANAQAKEWIKTPPHCGGGEQGSSSMDASGGHGGSPDAPGGPGMSQASFPVGRDDAQTESETKAGSESESSGSSPSYVPPPPLHRSSRMGPASFHCVMEDSQ